MTDSRGTRSTQFSWALLTLLIFIAMWAPVVKIYHYNAAQIQLGIFDLAVVCGLLSLVGSALLLLLIRNESIRSLLLALALGLATVATINSYLIPAPTNVLDGENYATAKVDYIRLGVLFVLLSVAAGLWYLQDRLPVAANAISRFFFGTVVLYGLMFSAFAAGKGQGVPSHLLPLFRMGDWSWTLSREKNILVLSFDAMQGSVATAVLRRNPDLAAKFDGFQNFSDAASVFPNTDYSIASVLTGRVPKNKADSVGVAIGGENFVRASLRAGNAAGFAATFASDFYKCDYCIPKGTRGFEANRVTNEFAMLLALGVNLAYGGGEKLVAYAMAPLVGSVLSPTIQSHTWKLDIEAFLGAIKSIRLASDRPVVQYRHYYATHQPNIYDRNCKLRADADAALTLDAVEREVTCALNSVGLLIDRLKADGIYDQTMLFIVSDHGYGTPVNELQKDPLAKDLLFRGSDKIGPDNLKMAGTYNASLIFKDFKQHGPLKTNPAPASLLDVTATICEEIKDCRLELEGQSLRKEISPDRDRRYWRYFGGSTYNAGWEKRFFEGLDEWFEVRTFRGSLEAGLAPSIEVGHVPAVKDAPQPPKK